MLPFPPGSSAGLMAPPPDASELLPSLDNPFFPSFGKSLHWPLQNPLGSSPASRPREAAAPAAGRKPIVTHCRPGGPWVSTPSREVGCCGAGLSPCCTVGQPREPVEWGAGGLSMAMRHGAGLQRVGQFSASPSTSSPGVWDVFGQSHALTRTPKVYP